MPARRSMRALLLSSAAMSLAPLMMAPQMARAQDSAEEIILLDPIVVDSKREVQTDTATAVTVVDIEEIRDRQAGSIAQLVESAPGVNLVNGDSPVGGGIAIRGFGATNTYGSNQKLGISFGGATKGSEEIYRLSTQLYTDPMLFREVKVTRGTGGTFEYGTGMIGGLIELEPINASDITEGEPGFAGRQTLQYSTNGKGFTSSTILGWQLDDQFEVLANYTWRTEEQTKDGNGDYRTDDGYTLPSWLVNARYTFGEANEHAVSLMYSHTEEAAFDVPYNMFSGTVDFFGNVNRWVDDDTTVLRYTYDSPVTDLINITADVAYSDQTKKIESTSGMTNDFLNSTHEYETTTYTARNQAFFVSGEVEHDLRTGVQFIDRKRADADSSSPGGTDKRWAIYLVDDMSIGNLTLTPQIRYEDQHLRGAESSDSKYHNTALVGGLSAHYAFDNGFALFGGAYYNESLPIIDDYDTPAFMTQPEKAQDFELGFAYDGNDLFSEGDALALKVTAYKTFTWDLTSAVGYSSAEFQGLEIEGAYSMANGIYVDANANFIDTVATTSSGVEEQYSYRPQDDVRVSLGYRWNETLDVSWEMVHALDLKVGATEYPAYTVNNLRATYMPQLGGIYDGLEVRVGVENVFDVTYKPAMSTYNAKGRNFVFTLAKSF